MPIRVKRNSLAIIAFGLSVQVGLAQNAPAAAPAAPASPTAPLDNDVSSLLDYSYNHKAQEGTAAKAESDVAGAIADKIKALDVLKTPGLDDPEVRARFETYISLKEVPQDRIDEYFGKMTQVSEVLKAGKTFDAWKLLYALSEYKDLDAGISRELANRVEGIWNSDRTQDGLDQANAKLRSDIDTYGHNADMIADDLHNQDLEEKAKNSGGNNKSQASSSNNSSTTNSPLFSPTADPVAAEAAIMPTMSGALQRKMELTNEYLKLLEARANITLNQNRQNRMTDQDKADFADYIKTLYTTHRYYHVIIAADFYRSLFNEGDSPQAVAKQVASSGSSLSSSHAPADLVVQAGKGMGLNAKVPFDMVNQVGSAFGLNNPLGPSQADHPLSLSEEVTSALEINNRVNQAIEVFKYKADKGEIASAAEQLQEAFLANEYHPSLQGLLRDQKEKVGDFLNKLDVLKNQLEARVFEQVDGQIADIKKIATDFDSTKPLALVNAVKLESRLRLGKAKLMAQGGDTTDAMKEFSTAAEVWPGNPDLQNSASSFFDTKDVQNESTTEFDRLVKDQNYREIFDKQLAFAPAIKGDDARIQQLKDALEKVQKAEMAEQKANMLVMNGDVDGAWETVESATKDWPDDMKLNKLLADLSGRGADFVSAINKARDAEAKKELGYSLTWYVNAQAFYPASQIANDGIDRISKQILTPPSASPSSATN